MKKVLVITYYWPPSGGPGVQRWLKFVKYFPEFGIEPVILTVDPAKANYPVTDESLGADINKDVKVFRTNSFEFYNLYKKLTGSKEVPYSGFANESKAGILKKVGRFVRGNFFLPDPRKGWNKYAFKKAEEIIKAEGIDTIITTSPPHSTQLIGLKLKKKYNLKWIADLRDPWTDIYYYDKFYPTRIAKKIDESYEREVLELCDEIVTVSHGFKRIFLSKSKKYSEDKIHVIPNGFDSDDFEGDAGRKQESFIITYTGSISEIYDIDSFVYAASNLIKKHNKMNIIIRFVGKTPDSIFNKFVEKGIGDNVELIEYVPHKKSIEYLENSSVQLLAVPKIKNNSGITPGKIFEYLAARKPILAVGPKESDIANIIKDCEAGETFEYSDKAGMEQFLLTKYSEWEKEHGLTVNSNAYQKYSREALTEKISNLIRNL